MPCSSTVCSVMSALSAEQHKKQGILCICWLCACMCVCVRALVHTAYEAAMLAEASVFEVLG